MAHAIKLREKGRRRWEFLTSDGALNRLRIHAARFEDAGKAQKIIDENAADNPGWEWMVVDLAKSEGRAA